MVKYLPLFTRQVFSKMEEGGRFLVDTHYIDREKKRRLLEESLRSSIDEIEKLVEIVK